MCARVGRLIIPSTVVMPGHRVKAGMFIILTTLIAAGLRLLTESIVLVLLRPHIANLVFRLLTI